ncbi:putative quinol monooxygenase [Mycetocola miduiensis]|jgi:quinol monooxygenase YgiN|uniref:Antibiotic biosynthesis monooxygenase n=1 Tax=Mycetocola miduiensis TaxID=995034 RepID=A0A1I4YZN8_9MICO|nr:antibiotic biosynthesis monooxygenase [Mycetocola miduiensis]SFN43516.1 Antibiotic biosynthesis monooxygenase [Mycetocola miduiensis]
MSEIHLTGQLICKSEDEARIVTFHLAEHIERTRAEPGCVSFEVTAAGDPLVWSVEERFEDERVFKLHQERVAGSEWGRVTAGIERRYSIEGLAR